MANDQEVKSKVILEGDASSLVATMTQAKTAVTGGLSEMNGAFNTVGGGVNRFIGIFGGLTAVIAGGALFKSIVSETVTWNKEAMSLAKTLGITTEQASILNLALGDVYLSQDTLLAGTARITKTLSGNEDAFAKLGVRTRETNGEYRSTIDIMTDVNTRLGQMKEGTDRNVAGMSIYGKSWGEVAGLLKLNNEVMAEAKEKAERLHLVVGPEGVENTKKYRAALNDVEDVVTSLKVQIGNHLVPALTTLGVAFGDAGISAASTFGESLSFSLRAVAEAKLNIQDLASRLGIIFNGGALGKNWFTKAGRAEIQAELAAQEQMVQYSLEKISERYGNAVRPKSRTKPGESATGLGLGGDKSAEENDKIYEKYGLALIGLNKQIGDSNPLIKDQDKAMVEVYATVQKLSEEMPQYIKTWNAYGEAMEQNIRLAQALKLAEEERDDYLKSDEHQNMLGKLGQQRTKQPDGNWSSQQDRFDDSASLSELAIKRENERKEARAEELSFYAERDALAGNSLTGALLRIDQEQQARFQFYINDTNSFEEQARRQAQIDAFYGRQRLKTMEADETRKLYMTASTFGNMATVSDAFYKLSHGKSVAAFRAFQALKSGETVISTAAGVMEAMSDEDGGSWYTRFAKAAATAAMGAVQLASIWSTSPEGSRGGGVSVGSYDGGRYGGESSSPIVLQPLSQPSQGMEITLRVKGHMTQADIEDVLIPGINEAGTRRVKIEYLN